jgi:hypothetical protein
MDLIEEQWTIVSPLLPAPRLRRDRRGRPWREPRDVLIVRPCLVSLGAANRPAPFAGNEP